MRALLLCCLLLIVPDWGWSSSAAPLVIGVQLRGDVGGRELGRLRDLIAIRPGSLLESEDVRTTLRNLHATGSVAESEVWTEPAPGGVTVTVAIWAAVLVESVEVRGDLGLRRKELLPVVEQREGQPLVEDRVLRSFLSLQALLEREGFDQARVRVDVQRDPESMKAQVLFEVEAGDRRRVAEVETRGAETLDGAVIAKVLRIEAGDYFREREAVEASERLGVWLREHSFLESEVRFLGVDTRDDESVRVMFEVDLGPSYQFEVSGWDGDSLRRHQLLPQSWVAGDDGSLPQQAEREIRNYLQQKGYYQAKVLVTPQDPGRDRSDQIVTRVAIDSGPVFRLATLEFVGNKAFARSELASLMNTTARRSALGGAPRLIDDELEADLVRLKSFYALAGRPEAKIGPPEIAVTVEASNSRNLEVTIPIVEGGWIRLVSLEVSGNTQLDQDFLLEGAPLMPGGAFHPQRLDETVAMVRSRYEQRGFSMAMVGAETDWNEQKTLVDVTLKVHEGDPLGLGRVIVRGNQRTQESVIRGVAALEEGERLSRTRLVEVQRSLYRLGVFSRVSVDFAPEGDRRTLRDVVIRVVEGQYRRVSYGLGYDSEEGLGGLLGYSHQSLWGRGLRFQADIRTSEKSERYRLLLSRGFWRSGSLPGHQRIRLTSLEEERTSFTLDQKGAELELAWDRQRTRYSLFLDFRRNELVLAEDVIAAEAGLPEGGEGRDLLDIDILSLTPRWAWDGRDDPIDPSRGSQFALQLEYAFPVGDFASENFLEFFGQGANYWPLGPFGLVAVNLRVGLLEPLSPRPVAISERFFAGGSTSHRAYPRDGLGIRNDTLDSNGNPLGGRGLLLANVDWRFPLLGEVGGTLFVDFGNVWGDWRSVELSEGKVGVGAGLRYLSPVGPLRVDIAWKLDREVFESPYELFFSVGNAF